MSISQLFPEEGPTLNLNFAGSRTLDPRITFTRTSTGTYMGSDGLIKVAPADSPRFDHRYVNGEIESLGLLVEESRSNLLTYSNDYSASPGGWTLGANATRAQDIVGPDGVANSAWTITDNDNTDDLVRFYKQISITPSLSTNYCISSFVKDINGTGISPEFYTFFSGSSTKGSYIKYNFSTDTITPFASDGGGIQPTIYGRIFYPNGWVRIYFVVNDANNGSNTNLQYRIYPNGRGANTTGAIGLYGSQIEAGAFPTSYIPRPDASTATRTVDNASITGSNFSSWFNNNEFSIFTHHKFPPVPPNYYPRVFDINTGNDAYRLNHYHDPSIYGTKIGSSATENNVTQFAVSTSSYNIGDDLRIASCFKDNDFASYVNGALIGTDNTGVLSATQRTVLYIGSSVNGSSPINGAISQLIYYPTRLPNSQLQALTR